jgi:hypothetical protein
MTRVKLVTFCRFSEVRDSFLSPRTLPPHRTVINEQKKKPENVLPFIRLTFELFQYPLECRPVRAFTFPFSDNKITRPPPPLCLPLLASPTLQVQNSSFTKKHSKSVRPCLLYITFIFFLFGISAQRNWGGRICICPVRGEWLAGCLGEWVDAITGRWIQITHTHTLPTISCIRRLHRHKKKRGPSHGRMQTKNDHGGAGRDKNEPIGVPADSRLASYLTFLFRQKKNAVQH